MIGEQILHYRVEKELGSGTYGVVYLGVHEEDPELKVAIKLVHQSLLDDQKFVDALKAECRRLDKMDHPAIVRFRDLVVRDGQVAMVLELLEGKDLHDHLHSERLEIDAVVSMLGALLEGLAYAHGKDVVHRDIKPSNIFVCDDGRLKILDFGIARAAQSTQATQTGTLKGTLDYMAPERFRASGGGLHSDVYALGLVAWEMLSGKTACPDGDLPEKLGWHLGVGAVDIRTVREDCPDWLADVIKQMVAKDHTARPQDAGAALSLFREAQAAGGAAPTAEPEVSSPAAPSTVALDKEEVAEALSQVARDAEEEPEEPTPPQEVAPAEPRPEPASPPPRTPPPSASRSPHLVLGAVGGGLLLLVLIGVAVAYFTGEDPTVSTASVSKPAKKKAARSKQADVAGYYRVSAGTFKMGSPTSEDGHERDETLHTVSITQPFLIGLTEVTQGEYSALMGDNPSENSGCKRCPVERVTWMDAARYCNALSRYDGLTEAYRITGTTPASVSWNRSSSGYRLPTEAEWEYAARAGDQHRGRFAGGSQATDVAWHQSNASATREVKQLQANAWGMYDVSGNVVEWVWDWYDKKAYSKKSHSRDPRGPASGSRKAARGGSWRRSAFGVRLANRSKAPPDERNNGLGFRVVRNAN